MEDAELDELTIHWRGALDAAEDSLDDVARSRRELQFSPVEVRERLESLDGERSEMETDLEALARTTHTHLHRHMRGPRASSALLGLATGVEVCLFDLDGVLTASAAVHAASWQETFDELLERHHAGTRGRFGPWRPFAREADYFRYIDGRPRIDGVHAFLASRGIRLPEGSPDDAPGTETAHGVANRKNEVLRGRLRREGVRAYAGSIRYLELAHEAKLPCAVVSASANTEEILRWAGFVELVDAIVDGNVSSTYGLRPKPAPDSILEACRALDSAPEAAATFETTAAGITAARAAEVAYIVAVDRTGRGSRLAALGADRVVSDLAELVDPVLG